MKKLYKSSDNKIFAGVIGGVGEYFNVDPVILRVAFILFTVFTGFFPGLFGYLICALIIPERPKIV